MRPVAHSVVNDLQARYPGEKVVIRDLAENPPPYAGRVVLRQSSHYGLQDIKISI
jgi:hypothetical protein